MISFSFFTLYVGLEAFCFTILRIAVENDTANVGTVGHPLGKRLVSFDSASDRIVGVNTMAWCVTGTLIFFFDFMAIARETSLFWCTVICSLLVKEQRLAFELTPNPIPVIHYSCPRVTNVASASIFETIRGAVSCTKSPQTAPAIRQAVAR